MSFSFEVKEELARVIPESRHCLLAEIAAITYMLGWVSLSEENFSSLSISCEHAKVARKYFTLLKKTYNIDSGIVIRQSSSAMRRRIYKVSIEGEREVRTILQSLKLLHEDGRIVEESIKKDSLLLAKSCCKRAFLRGAYLSAGSLSNPEKGYHFEIVAQSREKAELLRDLIHSFGPDAKIVSRKRAFVVYLKDSEDIVSILGIMEAPKQLMEMENIRIVKEMRNNVNRKVNCETANINRAVIAAVKQVEDIRFIAETVGLDALAENLSETARLRLSLPDISLKDLGARLDPPVGKSGMNHRLRKISEFASRLRNDACKEKENDKKETYD